MKTPYHIEITTEALSSYLSEKALHNVIQANISQDLVSGQIGHPEYHFDDSQIDLATAYIESLRQDALDQIKLKHDPESAWISFGKLTHAAQDFYAHTTYIRLWSERFGYDHDHLPDDHDILLPEILKDPHLISGRFYTPWEMITFLPRIGPLIGRLFPKDSHAYLNNDSPAASPYFKQVFHAAVLRTVYEYNLTINLLKSAGDDAVSLFNNK
jgi:hypothetical protein